MKHNYGEKIVGGYIPVINDAYLNFFDVNTQDLEEDPTIGVIDQDVLSRLTHLRKDIRALTPEDAAVCLEGIYRRLPVNVLGSTALDAIDKDFPMIMPDDEVTDFISDEYGFRNINTWPVFMRWDRKTSYKEQGVKPDRVIDAKSIPKVIIDTLSEEQQASTDWWRQVGSVLIVGGNQLQSHNIHNPTEYSPSIDGDPRMNANRGSNRDLTTVIHAEAKNLIKAARDGISTEGGEIFVTTFPCPDCAKLMVHAGIKRVYYMEGYAMVDGFDIMKANDVEIVKVEGYERPDMSKRSIPYPEKPKT